MGGVTFADWPPVNYVFLLTLCRSAACGYEVVALGTGNFNTRGGVSPNGRVLHDSHAAVTARRSLMRLVTAARRISECHVITNNNKSSILLFSCNFKACF